MGHSDVRDDPVAEEGADAALGVIVELIRDDELQRVNVLLHAPDRADRQECVSAQHFHPVDIRPVVELGGSETMSPPMPRQEDHAAAAEATRAIRVRRIAERCLDLDPVDIF